MPGRIAKGLRAAWRLVAHSLSGRLLLLTLVFVMITEGVIFFPSIGRNYRALLQSHIESAEIAILPFTEPGGRQLSAELRRELLARAGATAVMLERPEQRELFLVTTMPKKIDVTVDLRTDTLLDDIYFAVDCILNGGNRVLHVISPTRIKGAKTVEVIVGEAPIRSALILYAWRILLLALLLSAVTAVFVFFSLYFIFVRPMRRLTRAMFAFRDNPEDPGRIIAASARRDEIGITERELAAMQRDIYGFLQQKGRLAALGAAVAKIQHDLRNILASAQLASDRLSAVKDPVVQRLAPRIVAAIDRAVTLATTTLRYGRADETPPARKRVMLAPIAREAGEDARVAAAGEQLSLCCEVDEALEIDADPEQLYRILVNLLRNAVEASDAGGRIALSARRRGRHVLIDVADSGPGIAEEARAHLFEPFASVGRAGGTGLGLAISRDLARAHGGDVTLVETGPSGTRFRIDIPDTYED